MDTTRKFFEVSRGQYHSHLQTLHVKGVRTEIEIRMVEGVSFDGIVRSISTGQIIGRFLYHNETGHTAYLLPDDDDTAYLLPDDDE